MAKKGEVSISNAQGRIRLRWRAYGQRYSLNLGLPFKENQLFLAKLTSAQIELDIDTGDFDMTLKKYQIKPIHESPALKKITSDQAVEIQLQIEPSIVKDTVPSSPLTIIQVNDSTVLLEELLEQFNYWVKNIRSIETENSNYYPDVRNLFTRWGKINIDDLPEKFNSQGWSASTFNSRLECLKSFFDWVLSKKRIGCNPLSEVRRKTRKRNLSDKRRPFSEAELIRFLDTIKNNTFCPPSSSVKHSHYYPYLLFLALTGARNAEGIGLRVKHLNFLRGTIEISEAMARTAKGTNHAARIRKGTKTENIRVLEMTEALRTFLLRQVQGKEPDDLVFPSPKGLSIDDRMLQRRILKPVLKQLGIPERDLYVLRHQFGTTAIERGTKPTDLAYMMGHSTIQTVMRNYVSITKPQAMLPEIISQNKLNNPCIFQIIKAPKVFSTPLLNS